MLTRRGSSIAAGAALLLAPFALSGQAGADGPGGGAVLCGKFVCVDASTPGQRGSSTGGGYQSDPGAGEAPSDGPDLIPGRDCTIRKLDPQPDAGSDLWEGHKPGDGAIYVAPCTDASGGATNDAVVGRVFWAQDQPEAIDPAVLAQRAVDKMLLRGPEIGITPKPGGTGVIGMPVYMWTATGAETFGPNTASATAGAVTVTAVAKVSKIVWSMGDGKSVVCRTAGTPYKKSYGADPSPDCGHRYTRPSSTQGSGKYHVTATSTWTIDWAGGGATGQLTEVRNSAVDITVAEVQVVN
ncbi:ATP/GTP-binding protein [Streptomyces sp. NPDC102473]|uniref:ATP/GTP-binding protein n=1 Tax=Streptomyces sp. NPDC102473 TaxID=3366180 RepID=UPI00381C8B0C